MNPTKSAHLYYQQGGSDKEYHVEIVPVGNGYVVNFAYGRRGSTLNTGSKTQEPVQEWDADRIFNNLVREKKGKGYQERGGYDAGPAKIAVEKEAGEDANLRSLPQLLTDLPEERLKDIIWDDEYGMQEKKDGKRIMIKISSGKIIGCNRRGLIVSLPDEVKQSLVKVPDCEIDGELCGQIYYVFDLIERGWTNDRGSSRLGEPYKERYRDLQELARKFGPNVQLVPLYCGLMKEQMFNQFKEDHREGVVFKSLEAGYFAGRGERSDGPFKYKFYKTCSAVVAKVNKQRSVQLKIEDTEVGNVTIPPNYDVPKKGDVVEIRYLYYNKGGALYQPVYLGVRDDIPADDCTMDQLQAKAEN